MSRQRKQRPTASGTAGPTVSERAEDVLLQCRWRVTGQTRIHAARVPILTGFMLGNLECNRIQPVLNALHHMQAQARAQTQTTT